MDAWARRQAKRHTQRENIYTASTKKSHSPDPVLHIFSLPLPLPSLSFSSPPSRARPSVVVGLVPFEPQRHPTEEPQHRLPRPAHRETHTGYGSSPPPSPMLHRPTGPASPLRARAVGRGAWSSRAWSSSGTSTLASRASSAPIPTGWRPTRRPRAPPRYL